MKVTTFIRYDRSFFSNWIDEIKQYDSEISIGNNPALTGIIQKTWGWPAIHVFFSLNGNPVTHFQALKIREFWVSLPHFDHGGLWINTKKLTDFILNTTGISLTEERLHQFLLNTIQQVLNKIFEQNLKSKLVNIKLEESDLVGMDGHIAGNNSVALKCRSKYPLLSYHVNNKVLSTINLQASIETQMETFSGNVRRKIRKASKNGIKIKIGGAELLGEFFSVYRKNIHQLGSFGLPQKFFSNLIGTYEFGLSKVIIAEYNGKNIGAAIYFDFLAYAENAWFASLQEANHLYVTYALHNEMIKMAIENQCRMYSFGRSTRDSGVHRYKKQWGASDETLYINSTSKINDSGPLQKLAGPVIKILPQSLVRVFDSPVSKIIY